MEENQEKKECPKEECPKKECPEFQGFHGFGPRCHARFGFPPMWGMPPCGPHKHKERKCECGEVIPKRKPGEPKIKECPKCKKELPKKCHGFGMKCRKTKKFMKFMKMMQMYGGMGMCGFGPERSFCPPPPPFGNSLEVHHYIHFGPPCPPPPPMGRPPFFGPCPMGFGRPPFFGPRGPMGLMGPPPMGRPPCFGPCDKGPCEKGPCEKGICKKGPCEKGPCEWPCFKPPCEEEFPSGDEWGEEPCERPPFPWGMGRRHMGPPPCGPFGFGPHFGLGGPWGGPHFGFGGPWGKPPCEGWGKPPCCGKKCEDKKCEKKEDEKKEPEAK
jgi:hypothetical protein